MFSNKKAALVRFNYISFPLFCCLLIDHFSILKQKISLGLDFKAKKKFEKKTFLVFGYKI